MLVSQQIDKFIAENGGNERDALNVAMTRLDLATSQIKSLHGEIERLQNEATATDENAPAMVELLRDVAYPKRGSDAEKWSIHNVAIEACEILKRIDSAK